MIEDLLIDFDEMGFMPTTTCEDPNEYALEWKQKLIAEIELIKDEARKETAKEILQEWSDDNSSMGLDNTFVKNIAKKYGVEVEE